MVIVDTNIIAYLLIHGDKTGIAQALFGRDPDWRSEAFLLIEFSNVLATYAREQILSVAQAERLLVEAQQVMTGLVNLPHSRALRTAAQFSISAYDARFIGAAQSLGRKLVTEDVKLRAAAPAATLSLTEALERA